jgi:hypothetical protein
MARRRLKNIIRPNGRFRTVFTVTTVIGALGLLLVVFVWTGIPKKTESPLTAGVTFSVPYAKELGLNWREAFTATLDDLGVRAFRIPAYWSLLEPEEGKFNWSDIDYQMDEIAARNGKAILAVGAKLPRWPECWIPDWAERLGRSEEGEARLRYIRAVVDRYKDHPALMTWQVENEALFHFGICPPPSRSLLKREIELVRRLDISHEITTTDSGELSFWFSVGSLVDKLGISTYRVVTTFWGAIWHYTFIPPYWYAKRALLIQPIVKEVYVSEFQMEPWITDSVTATPISEQMKTFDVRQMEKNFAFAERMRFKEIYFWGVEWWWWMKVKQRDDRFWETAKTFFRAHAP